MKFQPNAQIVLNNTNYQIKAQLGGGTINDVYLAILDGVPAPAEVVIKLARSTGDPRSVAVQGVRTEAHVLAMLNRAEDNQWDRLTGPRDRYVRAQQTLHSRYVVALLDRGHTSDEQPFVVQELAPAAFCRIPIDTPADEWRVLVVASALAKVIQIAHSLKLTLKDFEPEGEKLDRLRIDWNEPANIKVIDWNITGGPAAADDGAGADARSFADEQARDILCFGGHLYYMLLGQHIRLDEHRLPADLGLGAAGWERLTEGSRQIVRRLLHYDTRQRYRSARELRDSLSWWLDTLAIKTAGELERSLRLVGDQPERKLAIADLALQLDIDPSARHRFEQLAEQARRELERAERRSLDSGIINLNTALYRKALDEFERVERDPRTSPEVKRQAHIYRLAARAGALLKEQAGGDSANSDIWRAILQVAEDLRHQRWQEAVDRFDRLRLLSTAPALQEPLLQLYNHARSHLSIQQASRDKPALPAPPASLEDLLARWLAEQQRYLSAMADVLEQYRQAAALVADEPDIQEYYRAEQELHNRQRRLLQEYRQAGDRWKTAIALKDKADRALMTPSLLSGDDLIPSLIATYRSAAGELATAISILDAASARPTGHQGTPQLATEIRAQIAAIQGICQSLEALPGLFQQIQRGAYSAALARVDEIQEHVLDLRQAKLARTMAQAGLELERQAQALLDDARAAIQRRSLDSARRSLAQLQSLDGRLLVEGREIAMLPADTGEYRFVPSFSSIVQQLDHLVEAIADVHLNVLPDRSLDDDDVITSLRRLHDSLESQGFAFSSEESQRLEEALQISKRLTKIEQTLADIQKSNAPDASRIMIFWISALTMIQEHPTPRAQNIRHRIAQSWLNLSRQEPDFKIAANLLRQGSLYLDNTPVIAEVRALVELIERGTTIAAHVGADGKPGIPPWVHEPEWTRQLALLVEWLDELRGASNRLSALKHAAQIWAEQLAAVVDLRLSETYKEAYRLAERRAFGQARLVIQEAWRGVPKWLRDALPDTTRRDTLLLSKTLDQRQQAQADLRDVIVRLTSGAIDFATANALAKDILSALHNSQLHPGVTISDIELCGRGLQQAASLAEMVAAPFAPDMQSIAYLRSRSAEISAIKNSLRPLMNWLATAANDSTGQDSNIQIDLAPAFAQCLDTLDQALQARGIELADRMSQSLQQYGALPGDNPNGLVNLFWNVHSWVMTAPSSATRTCAEQALAATKRSLQQYAARLWDIFAHIGTSADYSYFRQAFEQLRDLNTRLARRPIEAHKLASAASDVVQPVLDEQALRIWDTCAHGFQRLARALPDALPPEFSPLRVAEIVADVQDLQDYLVRLKRDVCPKLPSSEELDQTWLDEVSREAQTLVRQAHQLGQAYRAQVRRQLMEGFAELYAARSEQPVVNDTWLLETQHAVLTHYGNILQEQLSDAIQQRMREILAMPDPIRAGRALHDEFLIKSTDVALANSVEAAILESIHQPELTTREQIGGLLEITAKYRQLFQYRIVQVATQPWALPLADDPSSEPAIERDRNANQ